MVNRRGKWMFCRIVRSRGVDRGIGNRARDLVQSIGDGANQIFHAVTHDSGNGVEWKIAALAEIAKSFETRAIRRGVQFGGDDDHRFFDEGSTEGFELAIDDFERMDRIIGIGLAGVDEMDEEAGAFDVTEKADAEGRAQWWAFHEAWKTS